jgi:hypothetical protein
MIAAQRAPDIAGFARTLDTQLSGRHRVLVHFERAYLVGARLSTAISSVRRRARPVRPEAVAPTYDGLYTGSWQHPKCLEEMPVSRH